MIDVVYKPSFVRQYRKLPNALREEVGSKIAVFKEDPSHPFLKTHKLKGRLKGCYSFSVNYEYRIVFVYESKKRVALLAVGNHDVYDN